MTRMRMLPQPPVRGARIPGFPGDQLLGRRLTALIPLLQTQEPDASGFQDCEQRLASGLSRSLHVRRVTLAASTATPSGEVVLLQEINLAQREREVEAVSLAGSMIPETCSTGLR